jgi:hypothetical protein
VGPNVDGPTVSPKNKDHRPSAVHPSVRPNVDGPTVVVSPKNNNNRPIVPLNQNNTQLFEAVATSKEKV